MFYFGCQKNDEYKERCDELEDILEQYKEKIASLVDAELK